MQAKYGPSGPLKEEIAGGGKAEVFASANMEHPRALAQAKRTGPVVLFARNRLCALVRPGLAVTPATLLDRMLDPQVKLGTSTPRADPAGDYAWEVFRKADKIKAGAFAALEQKALQLTGGPASPPAPAGRAVYGALVADGRRTSSSPTAPTHWRRARTPGSTSLPCPGSSRSVPTTGLPSRPTRRPAPTASSCSS